MRFTPEEAAILGASADTLACVEVASSVDLVAQFVLLREQKKDIEVGLYGQDGELQELHPIQATIEVYGERVALQRAMVNVLQHLLLIEAELAHRAIYQKDKVARDYVRRSALGARRHKIRQDEGSDL